MRMGLLPWPCRVWWVFGLGLCLLAAGAAEALSARQVAQLGQAETALKAAEADLAAARESAGTAANPAKGSRLRLTQMRLEQASQRLAQATEVLANLPADDNAVKPVQARHDAVATGIAEVQAIITPPAPGNAPGTSPGASPGASADAEADKPADKPATAPAPRLDYRQEKLLKDAQWYLRETIGYNDKAAAVVAQLDADGPKPVHSQVRAGLESLATGVTKQKLAVDYINQLPGDHPAVATTAKDINAAADTLRALQSRLEAEDARLSKFTGMENYPQYNADFELLGDLIGRYRDFEFMVQQPEKLAAIIAEDGQVMAEVKRIAVTYLPLVEQKTDAGARMEKRFAYFQEKRGVFAGHLMAYKEKLPDLFAADIAEAQRLADMAVENRNALFFGPDGGIAQNFGFAEDKLQVLWAFGEEEAKPYVAQLEEARAQIAQRAAAMESQIIAANTPPEERFKGEDRDAIVKVATEAWAKQQPDAEILGARITSPAWARDTRWEWFNGSFRKYDSSHVQVQLLVGHDKELVVIRPINVYMNHLMADTLGGYPMDTMEEKLLPQRFFSRDKLK